VKTKEEEKKIRRKCNSSPHAERSERTIQKKKKQQQKFGHQLSKTGILC
jgi:sensor histidine kinase YesM